MKINMAGNYLYSFFKGEFFAVISSVFLVSCGVQRVGYTETDGVYYNPNSDKIPEALAFSNNHQDNFRDSYDEGILEQNRKNQEAYRDKYRQNWGNPIGSTSDWGIYSGTRTLYYGVWDSAVYGYPYYAGFGVNSYFGWYVPGSWRIGLHLGNHWGMNYFPYWGYGYYGFYGPWSYHRFYNPYWQYGGYPFYDTYGGYYERFYRYRRSSSDPIYRGYKQSGYRDSGNIIGNRAYRRQENDEFRRSDYSRARTDNNGVRSNVSQGTQEWRKSDSSSRIHVSPGRSSGSSGGGFRSSESGGGKFRSGSFR